MIHPAAKSVHFDDLCALSDLRIVLSRLMSELSASTGSESFPAILQSTINRSSTSQLDCTERQERPLPFR